MLSNAGKCVRVRWPDGSETQELVGTASRSQGIYDHGHQYTAHGTYDVLLVQQRGVFVPVELTSVELWEAEWPRASDARSPEPADGKAGADAAGDGGGTCR
ncbi:MAG TPA: hypothetical protein VFZ61_33685 [Polyangiales bacterium]